MSYREFQGLCEACFVTRSDVEETYEAHPHGPWSSDSDDYTNDKREEDTEHFLNAIFGAEGELDLQQLSTRIAARQQRLISENAKGGIWATIGNIRTAIAKVASTAFCRYLELLPDPPRLDIEEIRNQGKPSPYGDMEFPTFVKKKGGGITRKGNHPADHEAAAAMYDGNLLALLIAREYDFEEHMP